MRCTNTSAWNIGSYRRMLIRASFRIQNTSLEQWSKARRGRLPCYWLGRCNHWSGSRNFRLHFVSMKNKNTSVSQRYYTKFELHFFGDSEKIFYKGGKKTNWIFLIHNIIYKLVVSYFTLILEFSHLSNTESSASKNDQS